MTQNEMAGSFADPDTLDLDERIDFSRYSGGVACFTLGCEIATLRGAVRVDQLRQGDLVLTRDNGMQPVGWVGHRPLEQGELSCHPEHGPVRIRKGALGNGLPLTDLYVSPNHRLLVQNQALRALSGANEAFIAATDLVGAPGIERCAGGRVDYFHVLFERHEVILSNGAWTESFQPGLSNLGAFHAGQRDEVLSLFPELAYLRGLSTYGAARDTIGQIQPELLSKLRNDLVNAA